MSWQVHYHRKPSALAFLVNALRPSPGMRAGDAVPDIRLRWQRQRASRRDLRDYARLAEPRVGEHVSVLYPHVASFSLQMALLTHPRFPLPIWRLLQVRNHLSMHQAVPCGAAFDLEVATGPHRWLEKGLEFDVLVRAEVAGKRVWDAVNTYYAKGYRPRGEVALAGSDTVPQPGDAARTVAQWRMPGNGRWRFGRLTGDFNGLHLFGAYARRQGYGGAFCHPQRALGACLSHLGADPRHVPQRLEAWVRGPVFYGADLRLETERREQETRFALYVDDESRPALLGRLSHPFSSLNQGLSP